MRYFFFLSLPLYLLDQVTKYLIVANFPNPYVEPARSPIEVIPGFFNIVRVHNTGMAFGKFNGSAYANIAFGIIAISALIAITVLWRKNAFPTRSGKVAAALLVSGILGNFTDRILPGRGYVVDFLDFQFGHWHYPSFNVADSCICIAAALLFLSVFQKERAAEPKAKTGDQAAS
ncbi:MAG: signal peptidase II [Verrucomicrobiae bacterium]|nr:signal peptidase II [Verrucomicrobiae bacterium]